MQFRWFPSFRFQFRRRYPPRLPAYAPLGAAQSPPPSAGAGRGHPRLQGARSNRLSDAIGMPARPRLRRRRASSASRAADGGHSPAWLRMGGKRPLSPVGWGRFSGCAPVQDRSRKTFKIGRETMPASDAGPVFIGHVFIDRAPGPRTAPARPRSWCARTRRLNRRQSDGIRRGGTSRER